MRRRTPATLALAGVALTGPAVALAAEATDPPSPVRTALRAPFAGHLTVAHEMRAEKEANLVQDLAPRALRAARRTARVRGEDFSARSERRRLRGASSHQLRERIRELRRERRAFRRREERREAAAPAATSTAAPHLEAIAACESGGDPGAIGGGGAYRGKYQFSPETWASVGGSGDPAAAPEAEQDMRAQMLYEREGSAPWPVCGG